MPLLPKSFRIDEETSAAIGRLARESNCAQAEIIRRAVALLVASSSAPGGERAKIEEAIRSEGSTVCAAKLLGLSYRTLIRRMHACGLSLVRGRPRRAIVRAIVEGE